jgi:hypothetical protein
MPSDSIETVAATSRRRLLSPLTDPQTYRNIAFLLLRLPLGIAYFTVFLSGLAIGVSLIPLVIGVPILGLVLGFTDYAASFETDVFGRLLGKDISQAPVGDPSEEPLVPYLKATLTDPRSYLLVGYFLLSLFVGIGTFMFVVVVFSVGVTLAAAPLVYPLPFTQYAAPQFDWAGSRVVIDTMPEAVVVSLVGLVGLFVGVHVANTLTEGHVRLTRTILRGR